MLEAIKHIELDLHFIRDKVLQNALKISYIPPSSQVADIFTKHLPSSQTQLSVVPRSMSLQGMIRLHLNQLKRLVVTNILFS